MKSQLLFATFLLMLLSVLLFQCNNGEFLLDSLIRRYVLAHIFLFFRLFFVCYDATAAAAKAKRPRIKKIRYVQPTSIPLIRMLKPISFKRRLSEPLILEDDIVGDEYDDYVVDDNDREWSNDFKQLVELEARLGRLLMRVDARAQRVRRSLVMMDAGRRKHQ